MSEIPDTIVVRRDLELAGRRHEIWVRRALFAVVAVIPVLALINVFGQRPETSKAGAAVASLKVYAPERVRSGLLYQARFHVTAKTDLKNARLVLDPGWLENMTVNSIEPQPVNQASDNGRLSLELGHIPAGTSHLLFVYFQVNPTNLGHRSQNVTLYDGDRELFTVHRTITISP